VFNAIVAVIPLELLHHQEKQSLSSSRSSSDNFQDLEVSKVLHVNCVTTGHHPEDSF